MKYLPWLAFSVVVALTVRALFPVEVTVHVPGPPAKPDTVIVERIVVDSFIEYREVVVTDTVNMTHEVVIAEPQLVPCPDLPRIRGITRLAAGQGLDDTTRVALVDVWYDGQQIAITDQVQTLYTPGPITYLEASDPVRVDFGQWPEKPCGFWCKAQWAVFGFAGGVIAWEIAR